MPLYKALATCEVVLYVADDLVPTRREIEKAARDEINYTPESLVAASHRRVVSIGDLPLDWASGIPRGDNPDGRTCEEILALEAASKENK